MYDVQHVVQPCLKQHIYTCLKCPHSKSAKSLVKNLKYESSLLHPSIHPLSISSWGKAGPNPGDRRGTPGNQRITGTTYRDRQFRVFNPNLHVGLWEEAGVPGENPHRQTPSSNREPSCCEATVLTTTNHHGPCVYVFLCPNKERVDFVLMWFGVWELLLELCECQEPECSCAQQHLSRVCSLATG